VLPETDGAAQAIELKRNSATQLKDEFFMELFMFSKEQINPKHCDSFLFDTNPCSYSFSHRAVFII